MLNSWWCPDKSVFAVLLYPGKGCCLLARSGVIPPIPGLWEPLEVRPSSLEASTTHKHPSPNIHIKKHSQDSTSYCRDYYPERCPRSKKAIQRLEASSPKRPGSPASNDTYTRSSRNRLVCCRKSSFQRRLSSGFSSIEQLTT